MADSHILRRLTRDLEGRVEKLRPPEDLQARFGGYRDRPEAFVREVLGATPEPYQAEVLEACTTEARLAWRAAHGVGKSCVLSWVLLWWLLTRPFSRCLVLAPAFERQVGRYLLPETKKWVRRAPQPLPVVVRANSVEVRGYERDWFGLAVQASDAAKVEGAHAESLCVLADEAKALHAEVVAALHGTQTDVGGDRLYFLASVPGAPDGPFFDVFRRGTGLWRLFHTSAEDSSLVSPTWVEERRQEWGEHSPLFVTRVQGDFPEQDEGTLFKLGDLEAAVGREFETLNQPVSFGVDPARFGPDRTAVAVWCGATLLSVETRQGLDTMATAAWVSGLVNRYGPAVVRVDEVGVGGGVLDRLRQLGHRGVKGVNAGATARRSDLFFNKRAELAWNFREALERGELSLPDDAQLLAELSASRFDYDSRGRIKLEPKDETKKRVGHSPDLADACLLGAQCERRRGRPFVGLDGWAFGFHNDELPGGGFVVGEFETEN